MGREEVAKEAARLLYSGVAEEYKQAKELAAQSLRERSIPSNYEVAVELDRIADEVEGEERRRLLVEMREQATALMRALSGYGPVLTGSVWRGTARKGSDIDINVYATSPEEVVKSLAKNGYDAVRAEEETVVKGGRTLRSTHVFVDIDGIEAEVVVRPREEEGEVDRCEIYGDLKRGLGLPDLERLMKTDPLRKFIPKRRYR